MPLHYALRAVRSILEKNQALFDRADIESALAGVGDYLNRFSDTDPNTPVRKNLEWVRECVARRATTSA